MAGWEEYLEILAFFGWSGFEFWFEREPFLFFESAIGQKDVDLVMLLGKKFDISLNLASVVLASLCSSFVLVFW